MVISGTASAARPRSALSMSLALGESGMPVAAAAMSASATIAEAAAKSPAQQVAMPSEMRWMGSSVSAPIIWSRAAHCDRRPSSPESASRLEIRRSAIVSRSRPGPIASP